MSRRRKHTAKITVELLDTLRLEGAQTPRVIHDTEVPRLGVRIFRGGGMSWVIGGRKVLGPVDEMSPDAARRFVVSGEAVALVSTSAWSWRRGIAFYADQHRTPSGRPAGESQAISSKLAQVEKHAAFIDRSMVATKPADIAAFLATYLDSIPPRAVQHNQLRRILVTVWNFSIRHGKVAGPCPVQTGATRELSRRDYMSRDEYKAFLGFLEGSSYAPWVVAYAKLSYALALRGHEALRLKWSHVDRDRKLLIVPERKSSGQWTWMLYRGALEALDMLQGMRDSYDRKMAAGDTSGYPMNPEQRDSDDLFPAPRGGTAGWVELPRELSRVARQHWPTRKLTAHTLRRSRATHLRDAGRTDLEIIALTGHSNARQLQRYIGEAPAEVLALLEEPDD